MQDAVKFGTSGLRGPAPNLTSEADRFTRAFLGVIAARGTGEVPALCLARDMRASSPEIAERVAMAAMDAGVDVHDCGALSTPALALHALALGAPAIMVTGSHIPADRNGMKFFTAQGEITKADERAIRDHLDRPFTSAPTRGRRIERHEAARAAYNARCAALAPAGSLSGWRLGVFEHSTVLRDTLIATLMHLGAQIVRLGESPDFVPVDTEAFDDPALSPLAPWVREHGLDGVVSADADGDRPLLMDETGVFVRGDALGAIAARALEARRVAVPVTANSGLEACLAPARVERTMVGSPYVLDAMAKFADAGVGIGFEANGGVMLGNDVPALGLSPLPTRDAMLPLVLTLSCAARAEKSVSSVVRDLDLRPARAGRVAGMTPHANRALLDKLEDREKGTRLIAELGAVTSRDDTDGPRFTLEDGAVIHFRASGNAPEMRCYSEARDPERADALLRAGLALIERFAH